MRILVADISGTDYIRWPVSEFLGLGYRAVSPVPERLAWRGHEMLIKPGISVGDAEVLKPEFVMALMGWHGIEPERSKFYEHFFGRGVPVFTWGNDSNIPKLMVEVAGSQAESKRIVFHKPDHPILAGVKPEDIRTSGTDYRMLVKSVKGDIGLAYDPDNASWEIIYLEEWFGNHRWLHYHPYPCPPSRLVDNFLAYMTRPKDRTTLPIISGVAGAAAGGVVAGLLTRKVEYGAVGAAITGAAGAAAGWHFSE